MPAASEMALKDAPGPENKALARLLLHVDASGRRGSCSGSDQASSSVDTTPKAQDAEAAGAADTALGQHADQAPREKPAAGRPPAPGCVPLPTGVRVWTDPADAADPINSGPVKQHWAEEAFALTTLSLYLGTVHILLLLALAAFVSPAARIISLLLWSTLLLPTGPLYWSRFVHRNPVWSAWRRYFRFSVVFDGDIPLDNVKYVIPECPHGVFPLGQLIAVGLAELCWPGHPIYALAADAVFRVPIWRHVMIWLGAVPASAASFRKALTKASVGLVPGGIAEMFMGQDDAEVIKLRDRKGFVRIAVEAGAPLLPCFHFGNSRLFKWGPRWAEPYARKHRIALGLLFGRWGLPLGIPNHVPLMMVVGAPIHVPRLARDAPGFDAAVDAAHAAFITAMAELYDKYKGVYGEPERPLIIK